MEELSDLADGVISVALARIRAQADEKAGRARATDSA